MKLLKNRVLKSEQIEWRKVKWLQSPNFKEISEASINKLLNSLDENEIVKAFSVWEDPADGELYFLDGHHRQIYLIEGEKRKRFEVPDRLSANFIECKNREEAGKVVLLENMHYARITQIGFDEFIADFRIDMEQVQNSFNFDGLGLDLSKYNLNGGSNSNGTGTGNESGKERTPLAERFIVPPFSVLDTRQGYWLTRKRAWMSLGLKSELGRGDENAQSGGLTFDSHSSNPAYYKLKTKVEERLGREIDNEEFEAKYYQTPDDALASGTSVFDPVLTEICYKWFNIPGGAILDPFAGGSVRGVIAAYLGYQYTGIDLRVEQVDANRIQAEEILSNQEAPIWIEGDSNVEIENLNNKQGFDFIFSCPPYANLEVYSDNPADLSTMDYEKFLEVYRAIIKKACARLRDDRFACFVVGDVRGKHGEYYCFVEDTVRAFVDSGLIKYNELILLNQAGSLPIRINKQFSGYRKVGKQHQNVLVFYKGNPKAIKGNYKEIEIEDLGEGVEEL